MLLGQPLIDLLLGTVTLVKVLDEERKLLGEVSPARAIAMVKGGGGGLYLGRATASRDRVRYIQRRVVPFSAWKAKTTHSSKFSSGMQEGFLRYPQPMQTTIAPRFPALSRMGSGW